MLGLGHGINKSVIRKKYALDYIPGGVENNVLWLSYYQMTGRRNDECFRLRDLTTSDEWDIGRVNGYVEYDHVLTLLNGHTGLAAKIYNNTLATGATDAIQTNVANMPIVAEGGVFNHDGFKFVAASSNYMSIVDYAGIQLINPPINIYANIYLISGDGYVFCKNTDSVSNTQYSLFYSSTVTAPYWDGSLQCVVNDDIPGINKTIISWADKNANGFKINNNNLTNRKTLNTVLTNRAIVTIGCRGAYFVYLNGNIKTLSISADNLYDSYNILAARC